MQNLGKAQQAQSARSRNRTVPRQSEGLSTADKDKLDDQKFAFRGAQGAAHRRPARAQRAVAVSARSKASATRRNQACDGSCPRQRFDVEVSESDWRRATGRGLETCSWFLQELELQLTLTKVAVKTAGQPYSGGRGGGEAQLHRRAAFIARLCPPAR